MVIRDARLLAYTVASADMRYIEVNEREVYLRHDPTPVVRGEMPGCDSSCDADLSLVLLEYVISCEGCKGEPIEAEAADRFGAQLGAKLVHHLYPAPQDTPVVTRLSGAFNCILNSMYVSFSTEHTPEKRVWYTLAHNPLEATAQETGFSRGVNMAHRAFVACCASIVQTIAPDWALVQPSVDTPLLAIDIREGK